MARIHRLALAAAILLAGRSAAAAAQSPTGCGADSTYAALDFWVGNWRVFTGDTLAGTNRISKVLQGCAVTEEWTDADGSHGRSLFYVDPTLHQWKQVWVTDVALRLGGVKEKHLVAYVPGQQVRFQGELRRADGRVVLDRTTLTPLPGGEVRQLIEISTDGGSTWRATFDARYRRGP
jgi:hypothetical protein